MAFHFHKFEFTGISDGGIAVRRGNAYKKATVYHHKCIFCGKTQSHTSLSYWYYLDEKGNERMEYVDPL
jgi:hypothetical protein